MKYNTWQQFPGCDSRGMLTENFLWDGLALIHRGGNSYLNEPYVTGKPAVGDLGYAFLFRNYRPEQGKWQTSDPLGYPDGWNNFAYVNNGVTEYIDFQGLAWVVVQDNYDWVVNRPSNYSTDWIEVVAGHRGCYRTWFMYSVVVLESQLDSSVISPDGLTKVDRYSYKVEIFLTTIREFHYWEEDGITPTPSEYDDIKEYSQGVEIRERIIVYSEQPE